jgi:leader peptidase (prepilin peptidase)/N-methyltransferase
VSAALVALAAVLGALVGSFANVVIHRLPRGVSIVRPRSACPRCGRRLGPLELVPVLSWLLQLGRCRGCGARISARYPLVEALTAGGFALLAWRWSPLDAPVAFAFLAAWWAALTIATFIDLDVQEIPDALTLPGTALGLAAAVAWHPAAGLPGPGEAALGAAIGAGALTAVNRIGALVLRRLRDTRERLWPIGFDQANLAALAGALAGWRIGLAAAALSLALNLATRRTLRLPEAWAWGGWLLAVALSPLTIGVVASLAGGLAACGAAALAGAAVWWLHDLARGAPADDDAAAAAAEGTVRERTGAERPASADPPDPAAEEPVAMGFGDVKLAALLGVVLGWERLLVALFLAVLLGAGVGVAQRALGGTRVVPFGPFLAVGGVLGLFLGETLIAAYLGALGVG